MGSVVSIGVDIGQKVDPTALAVCEAQTRGEGPTRGDVIFRARHLERLPLGTPFTEVSERTSEVVRGVIARPPATGERLRSGAITINVDATGVGAPIVEMLKKRIDSRECIVRAVYFTHGDRLTRREDGLSLGKAYLVSRLQALLQSGRIKLPRNAEAEELARELLDYEIRVGEDANDKYGAFKVGTHDDLVTALGLAVLKDPKERRRVRVYSTEGALSPARRSLHTPMPGRDAFGYRIRE